MIWLWTHVLLFVLSWLFPSEDSPLVCLSTSPNLTSLTTCLDRFTVPPEHYTLQTYAAAQPTHDQRQAWREAITSLLWVDGNCTELAVPPSLQNIYTFRVFAPATSPHAFCVLIETSVDRSRTGSYYHHYTRGWGHVLVPSTRTAVSRPALHVSAPHARYDLGTVEQAAAIFELVGAKSLLLAGRTRTAYLHPSECIHRRTGVVPFYQTDPVHNKVEPFFDAFVGIYEWQKGQNGGCAVDSCVFLQMHGKAFKTCPSDQIFLSAGLNNKNAWYATTADYASKRLQMHLRDAFSSTGWNVSLPSDTACALTATTNVGGRYINGVPESRVCSEEVAVAAEAGVQGVFVHVEQAREARGVEWYERWGRAVRKTVGARCMHGMCMHPVTAMCVEGHMNCVR